MSVKKEVKMQRGENWVVLKGHVTAGPIHYKYAVSNHGRLIKFHKRLSEGSLLRLSRQQGFPIWRKRMNDAYYAVLLHRLVAKYFLPKPTRKQQFIMHLDFDKENNHYKNLRWATQEEITKHSKKNPAVIKAFRNRLKNINKSSSTKLTVENVKQVKSFLKQGKTLKELAKKFKISDMQIHRIKTGENWGHVK